MVPVGVLNLLQFLPIVMAYGKNSWLLKSTSSDFGWTLLYVHRQSIGQMAPRWLHWPTAMFGRARGRKSTSPASTRSKRLLSVGTHEDHLGQVICRGTPNGSYRLSIMFWNFLNNSSSLSLALSPSHPSSVNRLHSRDLDCRCNGPRGNGSL